MVVAAGAMACQTALDKPYNAKTQKEDLLEIEKEGNVSDYDLDILKTYLTSLEVQFGPSIEGKKYRNLLQRATKAYQDYLKSRDSLAMRVSLEVYDKGHDVGSRYFHNILFSRLKNETDVAIVGIWGRVRLRNYKKEFLRDFMVVYEDTLGVGEVDSLEVRRIYVPSVTEDNFIKAAPLSLIHARWLIDSLALADKRRLYPAGPIDK